MSRMIWALVGLIVAAFVFAVASFYLAERVTTGQTFFSNLFLNVVAELFGLGLVVAGTLILAVRYARKKLEELATPIAELVAQLRADKTLTPEAARRSMVCAVKLIAPAHISQDENNAFSLGFRIKPCEVCSLQITVEKGKPCEFCRLEEHVWAIKNKPVIRSDSF